MPKGEHLAELNRRRSKEMIGKKFGKLTVLKKDGIKDKAYTYECQCECGKIRRTIRGDQLRRSLTKSCGCDYLEGNRGKNLSKEEYYEHTKRRFLNKIKILNGCWEWQGQLTNKGYAFGSWGQSPNIKKTVLHRVAYIIWINEIPEGKIILHDCDNPKCINPTHLKIGTQKDNILDMYKKGRDGTCRGEKSGMAKLTENSVKEIRKMRMQGSTLKEIANKFWVSDANICDICSKKTWRHVVDEFQ